MRNEFFRCLYYWASQILDPFEALEAVKGFPRYFRDWHSYMRIPGAEPIRLLDTYPQVHDWSKSHAVDFHYFYANGWAMRRILSNRPKLHIDVGSKAIFNNLLSASIPVVFVDYRIFPARIDGLTSVAGDILKLPFRDRSVESISCLHVAEHIGLGRYGDRLDPNGTRKAIKDLIRVIAPGGNIYFAVPVGRPRLSFNAHRIHNAETIRDYFSGLDLLEFSCVTDDGQLFERAALKEFRDSRYACGMFQFKKNHDECSLNASDNRTTE